MKWSSTLTSLVAVFSLVLSSTFAEAKVSKAPKRKPASQNVTLDEIELDEDEPEKKPTKVEESAPAPVSPAISAALKKASALEEKKSYDEVVKLLKPLVDQLPRHGILILSRAYRATKTYQGELQMLDLVLAKNEKDYVVKTQEADVLVKLGRLEEATASYQAAKDLNKQYRPAYEGHWLALEKAKDLYEARTKLSDMIKVFGPTPKSQSELCRLFSNQDFLQKSEEHCRKAIELDPKNPTNYVHLGLSLRDQEHIDEAAKILVDAAKRFPASENVLATAAEMKANKKDYAMSYDLYKKATVVDPKSVRSWLGLAKSAHELQKYPEALDAFKKSCMMERKNSIQIRNAGQELKKNGNETMGQTYLDAAFDCDNNL